MHILTELAPLNVGTGARPVLRAASANDRRITGLNGERWQPALLKKPTFAIDLFDGDFTASTAPAQVSMEVSLTELRRLDASIESYVWPNATTAIYWGDVGTAWPWTQAFSGLVKDYRKEAGRMSLSALVDGAPFEKNVLYLTYAGTGDAEGGADLKDKPKPWVLGRAKSVEPLLINAVDNVYQFSAYGPIVGVTALYERGASFGASFGDYASYAALVGAAIPNGRWGTCNALGLVRLGAPAFGIITGDLDGDNFGGTFRRLTGAIIRRVAEAAGVLTSRLDTASLTALDAAVPYTVNIVLTQQETVLDLASRMALPCNAQAGVSLAGNLFVMRVATGAAVATLHAQGKRLPAVVSCSEVGVSAPYHHIEFGADRCWRVHTTDEIASDIPINDRGDYAAGTTYREGDIVTLPNGARYRYINPVATAGNTPPNVTYWEPWEAATDLAAIGAAPLSTVDALALTVAGKSTIWTTASAPSHLVSAENDYWQPNGSGPWYRRVAGTGRLAIGASTLTLGGDYLVLCWTSADDPRIPAAILSAAGAQATADGKAASFNQDETPVAEGVGDLWYQPSTKIVKRWSGTAWEAHSSLGAPAGTEVAGRAAEDVTAASVNFDARNDRLATAVVAPTIAGDGSAIDHTLNANGSADLSFEWIWGGTEADIDGFEIMVRGSTASGSFTPDPSASGETVYIAQPNKRAFILYGVQPTLYWTFAVRAFRVVDPDVSASGFLRSAWVQSAASGENPYRPETNTAFAGDVSGTVNGVAAAIVSNYTRNVDRGAWSGSSVAYVIGDEVQDQSSTWGALTNHTSSGLNGPPVLPTAENATWRLRAKVGDAGDPGDAGATGVSTIIVFQRSATAPSTPANNSGTPSGWYASTTSVPAGSNPIWATKGERASGATDYVFGTPYRAESISAVSTGLSVPLDVTTSDLLSFTLQAGESRLVKGSARFPTPTGAGSVYVQIEQREFGGTWMPTDGSTVTYDVGEPGIASHTITVTNSTGVAVTYEVRGTAAVSNANSGPAQASRSNLAI